MHRRPEAQATPPPPGIPVKICTNTFKVRLNIDPKSSQMKYYHYNGEKHHLLQFWVVFADLGLTWTPACNAQVGGCCCDLYLVLISYHIITHII